MKIKKQGIVLLAVFLAAMTMISFASAAAISAQPDVSVTSDETDKQSDAITQKLPAFMPSIKDKISYAEMKRLEKDYVPPEPIPESEIAQIIFPKTWVIRNDEDSRADKVELTFPVSWLDKSPASDDEAIVVLRVPRKLLELIDTNPNPAMITISYPNGRLKEFPNLKEINFNSQAQKTIPKTYTEQSDELSVPEIHQNQKLFETNGVDRQVRAIITRNTAYSIDYLSGELEGGKISNKKGETFLNYNEHEVYLSPHLTDTGTNDTIELIMQLDDDGEKHVWVAVYDEGTWVTPWNWFNIDVADEEYSNVYYDLYLLDTGVYSIYLNDFNTGGYWNKQYDDSDNPSTIVNQIMGSTELDTEGGISKKFNTRTQNIYLYEARSGWTTVLDPQTAFNWWGFTTDEQYVQIEGGFVESGRFVTHHRTGDTY
jgi:hypothetical protein